ncbi:MAG TPA: hypothetical protein VF201_07795 [Nitrolancea sp.]
MTTLGWIVYSGAVASVVVTLGLLLWTLQYRMSREMSDEFVRSYARTLRQLDNRRAAESESNSRRDLGNLLVVRPLPTAQRTRFADDWQSLQPLFINDPEDAVKEADRLISDVMRIRGYPVGEFARGAADTSAEPSDIVRHYREAHRLAQRTADGQATADEERRALVEYRELFDALLGDTLPDASPAQGVSQTG